jgi:hypothetical protein
MNKVCVLADGIRTASLGVVYWLWVLLSPLSLGFLDQRLLVFVFPFLLGMFGLAGQGTLMQETVKETTDKGGVAEDLSGKTSDKPRLSAYI